VAQGISAKDCYLWRLRHTEENCAGDAAVQRCKDLLVKINAHRLLRANDAAERGKLLHPNQGRGRRTFLHTSWPTTQLEIFFCCDEHLHPAPNRKHFLLNLPLHGAQEQINGS